MRWAKADPCRTTRVLLLAAVAASACADGSGAPGPTGSVAAHATMLGGASTGSALAPYIPAALNLPSGIVTMRAIVTASDMDTVGKDFEVGAGEGTVDEIPVGTERTLTLQGLDADGTVFYEGSVSGVTIRSGEVTDAGTIVLAWADGESGALDTSFNGKGYFTHNNAAGGNHFDSASGVLVDPSGRIVVCGTCSGADSWEIAIWRLAQNGKLDQAFNDLGYFTSTISREGDIATVPVRAIPPEESCWEGPQPRDRTRMRRFGESPPMGTLMQRSARPMVTWS